MLVQYLFFHLSLFALSFSALFSAIHKKYIYWIDLCSKVASHMHHHDYFLFCCVQVSMETLL